MKTFLFTHPACLLHDTGAGHPESSARLEQLLAALARTEFKQLNRREAPRALHEQLLRVHDVDYIGRVLAAVPKHGQIEFVSDTVLSPDSGEAALHAAGAVCAAVDAVKPGTNSAAFCAVRPPGHHAGPRSTMGFCLFNNIAIGAAHAREAHGLQRIAVIDFDVHHGNGTQTIFENDPSVLFASVHQGFIFPNTGARRERGVGNLINVPLVRGMGTSEFRHAFLDEILPRVGDFAPELVLISAGFDAHSADPLADIHLDIDDFVWVTEQIAHVAKSRGAGRIVSVLEGGYNPEVVARAGAAHVRTLMAA